MNRTKTEHTLHNGKAAVKLIFDYDAALVAEFRKWLPGLRHCYATHLTEAGVNFRYVQELLGHRHIKTVEIYLHVNSESICKIQPPFDTLNL